MANNACDGDAKENELSLVSFFLNGTIEQTLVQLKKALPPSLELPAEFARDDLPQ